MQALKYDVTEVLQKLKENRIKHEEEYNEAVAGWKLSLRARHLEILQNMDNNKFTPEDLYVNLPEPRNYLHDYDSVIAMLEMTKDLIIEIEDFDFQNYILDNWTWKKQFTASNSSYLAANAIRA